MPTNDRNSRIRDLFEGMVSEFGEPHRARIRHADSGDRAPILGGPSGLPHEIHPVFALAHHFRSNDGYARGYTRNPHRGDHMSIPAYLGFGEDIAILETSFHKGETFVEIVTFPNVDPLESSLCRATLDLLQAEETR